MIREQLLFTYIDQLSENSITYMSGSIKIYIEYVEELYSTFLAFG